MKQLLVLFLLLIGLVLIGCSQTKVTSEPLLFTSTVKHYRGKVPGASCELEYQVDLFQNKTYFIRTWCNKNNLVSKFSDDIGIWKQDDNRRIILTGGRESSQYFYILNSNILEVMDLEGKRIDSTLNYKLEATQNVKTIEPKVYMHGLFSYMADTGMFKEQITGVSYPVAMEEDYIQLEREYLKQRKVPAENLKVHLQGQIALRNSMEGNKKIPTLIVKKFIKIHKTTVDMNIKPNSSLINTNWVLINLNNKLIKASKAFPREARIVFYKNAKVRGHSSCNSFGGDYTQEGTKLSFASKAFVMTRMFCKDSIENDFIRTMKLVNSFVIRGEYLDIFDENEVKILRFKAVYLY